MLVRSEDQFPSGKGKNFAGRVPTVYQNHGAWCDATDCPTVGRALSDLGVDRQTFRAPGVHIGVQDVGQKRSGSVAQAGP